MCENRFCGWTFDEIAIAAGQLKPEHRSLVKLRYEYDEAGRNTPPGRYFDGTNPDYSWAAEAIDAWQAGKR